MFPIFKIDESAPESSSFAINLRKCFKSKADKIKKELEAEALRKKKELEAELAGK